MNGALEAARRLAVALGVLVAFVAPSATTLWIWTPSGADIQARTKALTDARHVTLLSENEVPKLLAEAVVATEDERFYQHHGVDSIGLARAVLYDVTSFCLCQGGSTITEQLVKDVYLDGSDRGYNKLEDVALALKVERVISKGQIMADYLSEITTGYGKFGVTAAACAYFLSPLANLSLAQYALLAGVTQAPSIYDPTINPQAALNRREEVLESMVTNQFITASQAAAANADPVLAIAPNNSGIPDC